MHKTISYVQNIVHTVATFLLFKDGPNETENLTKRHLGDDTIPVKRGKGLFLDNFILSKSVRTKILQFDKLHGIIFTDNNVFTKFPYDYLILLQYITD